MFVKPRYLSMYENSESEPLLRNTSNILE